MNKFKNRMKHKVIFLIIAEIFLIILLCFLLINNKTMNLDEDIFARQLGCLCGLMVGFGFRIFTITKSLSDEERLNKLYIQENDERIKEITKNTASTTLMIMLVGLTTAMVVTSFYSPELSNGTFYMLVSLLVVYGGTYFYYNRKF